MFTADTLTDTQIRDLMVQAHKDIWPARVYLCKVALGRVPWRSAAAEIQRARERVAQILNDSKELL